MDWEAFPTSVEMIGNLTVYFHRLLTLSNRPGPDIDYWNVLVEQVPATGATLTVFTLSAIFTVTRMMFDRMIMQPLGHRCGLDKDNKRKATESAWKFLFYTATSLVLFYLAVIKKPFLQKPSLLKPQRWDVMPWDHNLILMVETSYYFHAIYATLFMDTWKTDSPLMIFHHVITIVLIKLSRIQRLISFALVVLLTHDWCDVFLEFSKLNSALRLRKGKGAELHGKLRALGFLFFVLAWMLLRLFFYPRGPVHFLIVNVLDGSFSQLPFIDTSCLLLTTLLFMNLYWFTLILRIVYNTLVGSLKDVEDIRETNKNISQNIQVQENGLNAGPKKKTT